MTTVGMNMTTTGPLVVESIHGGLWAIMSVILIALVVLWYFAITKDWYRWDLYTRWSLTASSFSDGRESTRPNVVLLITRVAMLIFVLVVFILLFPDDREGDDWQYYTNWNFYLLLLYHIFAVGYSARGALNGWDVSTVNKPSYLDKFFVLIYVVCLTNVFLVDVLYWALLYPDNIADNPDCCHDFINISIHGLNFLVMMSELLQNRIRLTPALAISPCTFAFVYAIFQWIIGSTGLMLAYFFLDTDENTSPGWYLGIFVLHLIFYFIAFGLSKLKEKFLLDKSKPQSGSSEEGGEIIEL